MIAVHYFNRMMNTMILWPGENAGEWPQIELPIEIHKIAQKNEQRKCQCNLRWVNLEQQAHR
jgi:hypothetical protein